MTLLEALSQEALDTSYQHRQNVAMKHGLHVPPRNVLGSSAGGLTSPATTSPASPPPATMPPAPTSTLPVATALPDSRPWWPWLVSAAVALGGGSLGAAVTQWVRPTTATPTTAPASPTEAERSAASADGSRANPVGDSLLSDLQERGYHLPPRGSR